MGWNRESIVGSGMVTTTVPGEGSSVKKAV